MNKRKIINDPVYGFITIPYNIIFDIIEHPFYQRLRRIQQLGLTYYVYPGAIHTRFHHALGAMHLMTQAIKVLRSKGVDISEAEAQAVTIAILLHDIGHGPFSHALEHLIIDTHHENLSVIIMEWLNEDFDGALDLAIKIFKNQYPKQFLYQLVSSQLDMDRMDYLNRDSFFTGVAEGVIGSDRIIQMLAVNNGELVVEEKGFYSIEKFLTARRIMYWQVYLHKTVLCAEQMLIQSMKRCKQLVQEGYDLPISANLSYFFKNDFTSKDLKKRRNEILERYMLLDDIDILAALKNLVSGEDEVISLLANGIVNRKLFRVKIKNFPYNCDVLKKHRHKIRKQLNGKLLNKDLEYLVFTGSESNNAYTKDKNEIKILFKNGKVLPISKCSDYHQQPKEVVKYFLCYPKKDNI